MTQATRKFCYGIKTGNKTQRDAHGIAIGLIYLFFKFYARGARKGIIQIYVGK